MIRKINTILIAFLAFNSYLSNKLKNNENEIKESVLAAKVAEEDPATAGYAKEFTVNDDNVTLSVEKYNG